LDERLLALDRRGLSMGAGQLDCASTSGRGLGGRSLGATTRRLDLGSGPLAVKEFQTIDKIGFIAKGIDLLDVTLNAFLPSRASTGPWRGAAL